MRHGPGTTILVVLLSFVMVIAAVPAPALSAIGRANATVTCPDPDKEAEPGKNAQYNISVALDGSGSADITFSTRTNTGPIPLDWYVQLPYLWTVILPNENRTIYMNVTPPKNASVGEVLDVVLVMESADFPTGYMNFSTKTTVALNYKFNLSIDNTQYLIDPGKTARFNISVENVGNGPFGLDIAIVDLRENMTYELSSDNISLAKGETRIVMLNATAARFAPTGWYDNHVRFTPPQAQSKFKEILASTYVSLSDVLSLEVDHQSTTLAPGENYTFNFTVKNLGNDFDEVDLYYSPTSEGITGGLNTSKMFLAPNGTGFASLTVSPLRSAKPGPHTINLRASTHYGNFNFDKNVTVAVLSYYNFSSEIFHEHLLIQAGENITLQFQVHNSGNINDTYRVELLPEQPYWNSTANTTLFVEAGDFNYSELIVKAPFHIMPMDLNLSMVFTSLATNVSQNRTFMVTVERTIYWTSVSISTRDVTVDPGGTKQVLMYLENVANVEREYRLDYNPSVFWYIEIPESIKVGPFGKAAVVMNFTADLYSPATKEMFTVNCFTADDIFESWNIDLTLRVKPTHGIIISAINMPSEIYRGEMVGITFLVTNTGNVNDDIGFGLVCPSDWTHDLVSDMSLTPFEGKTKLIHITIPSKAKPDKYAIQLIVTSRSDPNITRYANLTILVKKKPVVVNPASEIGIYIFGAVLGMIAVFVIVLAMLMRPPKPRRPKAPPEQGHGQPTVEGPAPPQK